VIEPSYKLKMVCFCSGRRVACEFENNAGGWQPLQQQLSDTALRSPEIDTRAFTLIRLFFTNVGQALEAENR